MSRRATFHRTARPVPTPRDCILVAPSGTATIDGSGRQPHLCVRSSRHGRRRVPVGERDVLAEVVGEMARSGSTAVWLGGRARLTLALGGPPVQLERTLRRTAGAHGLAMHGFMGSSVGDADDLGAYDEVRDGGPVSTRQPTSRE